MTKLADLPIEIRRQIAQGTARMKGAAGVVVPTTTSAASAAPSSHDAQFRCHLCRVEFHHWAPAQRHRDEAGMGHGRIETLFDQRAILP